MNEKTILYQLTETSKFMMGFVLVTKQNNVIVIDGGRLYGTTVTRKWMDILGVKTHYITKDGTQEIEL